MAGKENGRNTLFIRNDRKRKIFVKSRFLQVKRNVTNLYTSNYLCI